MTSPSPIGEIHAPLINTNEPEALVVEVSLAPYSKITRGEHLFTLETSKATYDVESEYDGFVGPVTITVGSRVTAGDLICEVFTDPPARTAATGDPPPATPNRRFTQKAARLAVELGVDITRFPPTGFVTEEAVRAAAGAPAPVDIAPVRAASGKQAIVLFGGGGLARALIDLVRAGDDFEVIGIVDDDRKPGTEVLGVRVLGGRAFLDPLARAGLCYAANAVGAVGRIRARSDVSALITAAGLREPVLIEPTASVAASADLALGVQVFAQAVVSSAAVVGSHTIINSGAIVSHDCRVGANSHIAPGAILAGHVTVGDRVLVGMGVTAPIGVTIRDGALVGNGATLRGDVPANSVVAAGSLWPPD